MSIACEEGLAASVNDALEQPYDLMLSILELRNYARTKQAMDHARAGEEPTGEMVQLVWAITAELMKERHGK